MNILNIALIMNNTPKSSTLTETTRMSSSDEMCLSDASGISESRSATTEKEGLSMVPKSDLLNGRLQLPDSPVNDVFRKMLKESKLSQKSVSGILGISVTHINGIMNGRSNASIQLIRSFESHLKHIEMSKIDRSIQEKFERLGSEGYEVLNDLLEALIKKFPKRKVSREETYQI